MLIDTLNVTLFISSVSSFGNGFDIFLASKLDILPHLSQIQF